MSIAAGDPATPLDELAPAIRDDRVWIDGCFDFFHHGHAGAIVQARQLGNELYVGVHSDQAILENKGPPVMTLEERLMAVEACRWATRAIGRVPYVTQLDWISHYGCRDVVHGDDLTLDKDGRDCLRLVKAAGRYKEVRRTPNISTTDLVGRMLLCTRTHFISSLCAVLMPMNVAKHHRELSAQAQAMNERIALYATDPSGRQPWVDVMIWTDATRKTEEGIVHLVHGIGPRVGQRVVYVDGAFDLFSSGHMEFLRLVVQEEEQKARVSGWYNHSTVQERLGRGADYGPAYVIAGVHDDHTVNHWKGVNYPIMNLYERGLCILQCKYINAAVLGAPFVPAQSFLRLLPQGIPDTVYHGPTPLPGGEDPYADVRAMGRYHELASHAFADVNANAIVARILRSRDLYEARQRAKGADSSVSIEDGIRHRRELEQKQRMREVEREVEREGPALGQGNSVQ